MRERYYGLIENLNDVLDSCSIDDWEYATGIWENNSIYKDDIYNDTNSKLYRVLILYLIRLDIINDC